MQAVSKKMFHYHACANALGGTLDTPTTTIVPSQASVSLPQAGGYASQQGGAFNHENIISCTSTFTRVSGKEKTGKNGWSNQVTSIVEGFNILQVVTAERIVSQITVDHPDDGSAPRHCFAGSHFYGLRVHGKDVNLTMNPTLLGSSPSGIHWKEFVSIGEDQAAALENNKAAPEWAKERLKWMLPPTKSASKSANKSEKSEYVLCSLVDDVSGAIVGKSFAHYLDIPDIGRIFLGEVIAYPHALQLTMVRAELGCHVNGQVSGAVANTNSSSMPPH